MELSSLLRFDGSSSETPAVDKHGQKPAIKIGIVGCGSRGLTVLERLCALAGEAESRIEINVFEPRRPGPGLHSMEQPSYLMLNTVASQISMFPDHSALGGLAGRQGPNFYEWCLRFKSAERAVKPNEFLPRAWLGEYLAWTYDEVIRTLPQQVQVIHHARTVDNIEHTDLGRFELSTGMETHTVDWLLITIGHAEHPTISNSANRRTRRLDVYPQPYSFQAISPCDTVGVEGLGLSAMDAVAGLTVGRGGRFVDGPEGLRYQPSGQEPQVFMYARSGLPYCTRPDISPHRVNAPALIFTLSAVADLRARHPGGLDFETHVLPLIKAEMLTQYFATVAMLRGDSALRIQSEVVSAFLRGEIETKHRDLAERFRMPLLDERAYKPHSLKPPVDNYELWVKAFIQEDLRESALGLDNSPTKAAFEVWRSCREQLRRVVDNGGLTPSSHSVFFDHYAPLVNRLVAGPQKERHYELLALAEAGIVRWVNGANVIHDVRTGAVSVNIPEGERLTFDTWMRAYGSNGRSATPPAIIRQLRDSGIIHSLDKFGGGVQVDSQGKAQPNLWITGPIVEGATYYNHYVPSSGSYSRAFVDADRIAREMIGLSVTA